MNKSGFFKHSAINQLDGATNETGLRGRQGKYDKKVQADYSNPLLISITPLPDNIKQLPLSITPSLPHQNRPLRVL